MRHQILVVAGSQGQDRAAVVVADGRRQVVLADGAGGLAGGEVAADVVVVGAGGRTDVVPCLYELDEVLARDPRAGETTAVVVLVEGGRVVGASVGDSGAWWITGDRVVDLTEHQVRKPLLGSGEASIVPFEVSVGSGVLLVASDGLLKYATEARIAEVVRRSDDLDQRARALVELVRLRSGAFPDDVGVVLVEV